MKNTKQKYHKSSLSYHQNRNREFLESRRLKAAKLFKKGKTLSQIANIFEVSPEAVRQWKIIWKKQGIKGLKSKGKPGPNPRLNENQKKKVEQALIKGPRAFGYQTNIWTLKRIAKIIKKTVKVKYHTGYVWHMLRSMNWSCQRPRIQSPKRNEKLIASWKYTTWPAIKKRGVNCELI